MTQHTTTAPNGVTLTLSAVLVASAVRFPGDLNGKTLHNQFRVSVSSDNGARCWFNFFGSDNDRYNGQTTLDADALTSVLGCFVSDALTGAEHQDAESLMQEFGYDLDSRKQYADAKRVLKACQKSAAKLARLGIEGDALYDFANALNE